MTVAARKPARRKAEPSAESSVYDGARLLGVITPSSQGFAARLASGRPVGRFETARSVMQAICAAARDERLDSRLT